MPTSASTGRWQDGYAAGWSGKLRYPAGAAQCPMRGRRHTRAFCVKLSRVCWVWSHRQSIEADLRSPAALVFAVRGSTYLTAKRGVHSLPTPPTRFAAARIAADGAGLPGGGPWALTVRELAREVGAPLPANLGLEP